MEYIHLKNYTMKTIKTITLKKGKSRLVPFMLIAISLLILSTGVTSAHCDTMDGPVIKDAKTAIEKNNVNYVLKWIQPQDETELKEAFHLAMKVRNLGTDAKTLADKYFFETLVRLHRSGEGVPFTGVKPSGTPVDEKILAADRSVETGSFSHVREVVPMDMLPELEKRFKKVLSLKDFDADNTEAGRKYVAAYVHFFKYAEGEEDHGLHKEDTSESVHRH
jgi:hypothetical protein